MTAQKRPAIFGLLWTVLLLAPLAWTLALGSMFPMTDWVCQSGQRAGLLIVGTTCCVLALAAVAIGWSRLTRDNLQASQEDQTSVERSRFMLQMGIWMSLIFALVILLYIVPVFLLRSCPT